jgi:hypothetical protein
MIDNIKLSNTREVRKIRINVVGSVSDQEDIKEIETVAKVFVVEERMIDLTYDIKSEKIVSDPPLNSPKKTSNDRNSYNTRLALLTVRGFN